MSLPLFTLSNAMLLLSIALILSHHASQIRAMTSPSNNQTKLIQKACIESLEPQVCSQCITRGHSRQFDDIPGFIHSLLSCMLSKTTLARDTAISIASRKSTSPALRRTLAICSASLFDAVKQLQFALLSMENSHYTEAWNSYLDARRMVFRCALEFHHDDDFTFPSLLIYPMVNANRLCNAAYDLFVLLLG